MAAYPAVNVTGDALFDSHTITVRPPGVHKWRGVLAFCEHQGIDAGAVLAVGDGVNDIELLAAALACLGDNPTNA